MKKKSRRLSASKATNTQPLAPIGSEAYWLVLLRYFLCGAAGGFLLSWVSLGVHWVKGVMGL